VPIYPFQESTDSENIEKVIFWLSYRPFNYKIKERKK